jgi:hypothetical protein
MKRCGVFDKLAVVIITVPGEMVSEGRPLWFQHQAPRLFTGNYGIITIFRADGSNVVQLGTVGNRIFAQ